MQKDKQSRRKTMDVTERKPMGPPVGRAHQGGLAPAPPGLKAADFLEQEAALCLLQRGVIPPTQFSEKPMSSKL